MSEVYSDHYFKEAVLQKLSAAIITNHAVLEEREDKNQFYIEISIYALLKSRLADQSFRDVLTLHKKAKSSLFHKELNRHLIGPDGYESHIAVRGKDIDKRAFDVARGTGDGDLYFTYHYDAGIRRLTAVSKRDWYILYDKLLLSERRLSGPNAYIDFLDGIYEKLLETYLQHGDFTGLTPTDERSPMVQSPETEIARQSPPEKIRDRADQRRIVSLIEGQEQFASEIEQLSDREARDVYGALLSVAHQMKRMKTGLGKPTALDDVEVFVKSFETYVNGLDKFSSENLQIDYEMLRRSAMAEDEHPTPRYGAQALMVIVLGEMIRRENASQENSMLGYRRTHRMLERLERSLGKS
jgi:hypothetical protein